LTKSFGSDGHERADSPQNRPLRPRRPARGIRRRAGATRSACRGGPPRHTRSTSPPPKGHQPCVCEPVAQTIAPEIGVEMGQFQIAGHVASRVGVFPGNIKSTGRRSRARQRRGALTFGSRWCRRRGRRRTRRTPTCRRSTGDWRSGWHEDGLACSSAHNPRDRVPHAAGAGRVSGRGRRLLRPPRD
jgi:hypothetical protein